MKSVSKEDRINESSHALQLLSKSVETFGKMEDLSEKIKDNELIQRNNQPFLWNFDYGKVDNYSFGTRQQRKLFPHNHPPTWLGNQFLPLRGSPHTGPGCYTATDWNGLAYNLSRTPTSTKGYAIGARTAVRFKPVSKDVTPYPGMYQKFYTWNEKYKQCFAPFNALMPRFRTDVKGTSYPGFPRSFKPTKRGSRSLGTYTLEPKKPELNIQGNTNDCRKTVCIYCTKFKLWAVLIHHHGGSLIIILGSSGLSAKDSNPGTYNPEKKSPAKVVWPMKFGSPDWSQVPCLEKRTLKAELSTDKDFRKHRNRVAYFSLYYN